MYRMMLSIHPLVCPSVRRQPFGLDFEIFFAIWEYCLKRFLIVLSTKTSIHKNKAIHNISSLIPCTVLVVCLDIKFTNYLIRFMLIVVRVIFLLQYINYAISKDRQLSKFVKENFCKVFISAPEPKAQVHYCDHTLSVVRRPSVVRPSVRPSLTFTFLTSPLKPLNRVQRNLTGSKISASSTKFVFFGPIRKTRWPPRALIGWDTFDFFSKTAEGNSTKLDRKQDLNVLYQVCVFRADRKTKMAALASDWLRHFLLLLWNRWTKLEETWQEARSQCALPSLCFSGRSENQDGRPGLRFVETFLTSPPKSLNRLEETWQEARSQCALPSLCFSGWSENQDGRPGLWLVETQRLRHLII